MINAHKQHYININADCWSVQMAGVSPDGARVTGESRATHSAEHQRPAAEEKRAGS